MKGRDGRQENIGTRRTSRDHWHTGTYRRRAPPLALFLLVFLALAPAAPGCCGTLPRRLTLSPLSLLATAGLAGGAPATPSTPATHPARSTCTAAPLARAPALAATLLLAVASHFVLAIRSS